MGWRWVVTLFAMTIGSYLGGVRLHGGFSGAVLGALAAGLIASALWSKPRDRHIKP